jgi:hypothetical protein
MLASIASRILPAIPVPLIIGIDLAMFAALIAQRLPQAA